MLIISKNKDYYDGVANTMGIDKTIVYDRKTIELEGDDIPSFFNKKKHQYLKYYPIKEQFKEKYKHYSFFVVGFCGKLYIGWKLYGEKKSIYSGFSELYTEIIYDFNLLKSLINTKIKWYGNFEDNINYFKNYDPIQLFREFNTPIFIYDDDYERTSTKYYFINNKFIINPRLKDYEFYKIFDTFQTFQEIQMFIGGVLGSREKEITEVADKYKIQQHGFDYKWSFRKKSTKNK